MMGCACVPLICIKIYTCRRSSGYDVSCLVSRVSRVPPGRVSRISYILYALCLSDRNCANQ